MKINDRGILLLSVIFPLYLFFIWCVTAPFLAWFSMKDMNEKGLATAIFYDGRNAAHSYLLGKVDHYRIDGYDLTKAIRYYKESLRQSPLQGGCWLDLAKAYQLSGQIEYADNAIQRAVKLIPRSPDVMWEAGVFYLVKGDVGKSLSNFKDFILLRPENQELAYDMAWKLPLDSKYVLQNLIPDSYPYYKRYLYYLISTERITESKDLWDVLNDSQMEDEVVLRYADFLISKNLYENADRIWKNFIDKRLSGREKYRSLLLYNGSFENDILNGGFDWRITEEKGTDVFVDRDIHMLGGRSLGVTFDGTRNPDVAIASQVVRVYPNAKYLLIGNIKTDKLTTTNGIFFSVEGHDCGNLSKRSDTVKGTTFWKEVGIEFDVPSGCSAVTVNIRRDKSNKLDNKISGSAWIDGISLVQE